MTWPVGYIPLNSVITEWPAQRVLDTLDGLGFKAIDWSNRHFDPLTESAEAFSELVRRTRDRGLEVPQFNVSEDLVTLDSAAWAERVERTVKAVEVAAQASVKSVGVTTGPHPWSPAALKVGADIPAADAWELAKEGMRRVVAAADGSCVSVGLEPVWGSLVDSGEDLQRMLDEVPGLGVTFDPSHLVLSGDDIPRWIHAWKDRIVHVHLKDAFGTRGRQGVDFFFTLLGEGQVPWEEVLTALAAIGYDGVATIEAESYRLLQQCYDNNPTEPARLSLELAQRLFAMAGVDRA